MCGFLVQKKLSNNFKLNKKKFKIASKLIYHRGPDSKNYLYNESSNIFHSRLEIIDLNKRSSQPMTRMGYTIIFNGEIYNYKKIKKELESDFIFLTSSDTEVLLFSYIKWKKKMFDKIDGMYSFIIFNNSNDDLFFGRDLFGQKPLYYFKDDNQIIFSSEIKPILRLSNFKSKKMKYNDQEIYKYLNFNFYGDDKNTFFNNIYQIPPGNFGYLQNKKLNLNKINYPKYKNKINSKNILTLIKKEIGNHLVADVETAIMISEGVDSKSIVDISKKFYNQDLKLFNLEFEDFNNNEFRNKYLKVKKNLHFSKFLKNEMFSYLNKSSEICESPPLSLFTLGMVKLFKKINNKNIKVVLNGQGVDEVFGGYNIYFSKKDFDKTYHPDGTAISSDRSIYKKNLKNRYNSSKNIIAYRKDMAFKSKIPKNLIQIDKLSMNSSVECRSPFLTKNIAGLFDKLKLSQLQYKENKKYIFRKSLYEFTKDKFYFNEKKFKQAPQTEYMLTLNNLSKIKKIIKQKNNCDKYFNKKLLKKYFEDFKILNNNGFVIWQYLSLNSFLNYFNKFR